MRKFVMTVFVFFLFLLIPSWSVGNDTIIVIEGEGHAFYPQPVNVNGSNLVPVRPLLEAIGADVHWDSQNQIITCYIEEHTIKLPIESSTALFNGEVTPISLPTTVIDGTTFIPVRFVGEVLGYSIDWETTESMVHLYRGDSPPALSGVVYAATGTASWYGGVFHGRRTSSGEVFDQNALTAAHRTLPFGTLVRVTYLATGKSVVVRINDRGPHIRSRIIDLSKAAAETIGLRAHGLGEVQMEVLAMR